MKIRKGLAIASLILCGIFCATPSLKSADEPKPADPDNPPPPKIVTHVYDVRTLLAPSDDFPFETSPHSPAFVVPPNLQGGDISSYGSGAIGAGGGGNQLFGGEIRRATPTRAELADQLIKMITDLNARDTWRDAGGTLGTIREMNGMLIISQTEPAQKEIAAFLQQMTELRSRPIRTTADWYLLTPADVEKLAKPAAPGESGAPREVDAAALEKLPASAGHFRVEMPGHNGQTLHALSGHEKSVTVNQTATVGTGVSAFSPFIGIVADGVAIQVTPVVDYERKNAVITLFSTFNADQQQGPTMTLRSLATTQPSPGDSDIVLAASATYHEVSSTVQEFRTTLRIPLNTPVIAGAMTLSPSGKDSDGRELVLIVSVHSAD